MLALPDSDTHTDTVPPPAYSSAESKAIKPPEGSPSSYHASADPISLLPSSFRIGRHNVAPLISLSEVIDHLTFLSCLHKLQEDVRLYKSTASGGEIEPAPEVKWTAFCHRAALRFNEWATSTELLELADRAQGRMFNMEEIETALQTVDIDVLMAWHTYMLNPKVYADDMLREGGPRGHLRGIRAMGAFPLDVIVSQASKHSFALKLILEG